MAKRKEYNIGADSSKPHDDTAGNIQRGDNGFWACVLIVLFAAALAILIFYAAHPERYRHGRAHTEHVTPATSEARVSHDGTDLESNDTESGTTIIGKAHGGDVSRDATTPTSADDTHGEISIGAETPSNSRTADKEIGNVWYSSLYLPFAENDEYVVSCDEGRYMFRYDTTYRQSAWVAYLLTASDMESNGAERSDDFIVDGKVVEKGWPWAETADYANSGYDRGHLCPSADRNDNESENRATFLMSNISPQTPALNRGVWKRLEEQVRRWAVRLDSVYVVTGGVLDDDLEFMNGIGIPRYFYKVVLAKVDGEWQSAGFVMPNTTTVSGPWKDYEVTVDSVEMLCGLDFYYTLPDAVEDKTESRIGRSFKK